MTISDILKNFIREYLKKERLYSELCKVVSVDETKRTATVKPIDGATIYNVRIQSIESQTKGIVPIPKIDSFVIISFFDAKSSFISTFTECSKIYIDCDQITLNGGLNDGITKINDLVTKLNNLENKVNTIISTFNSHVHTGVTTGAGSSAVTPTLVVGTLTPTVKADLEDSKIKH